MRVLSFGSLNIGVEWAMEYASAAAAIAVTRPGAAPSIPSREEVLAEMGGRSEERRVGKECRCKSRSRWSPYH